VVPVGVTGSAELKGKTHKESTPWAQKTDCGGTQHMDMEYNGLAQATTIWNNRGQRHD